MAWFQKRTGAVRSPERGQRASSAAHNSPAVSAFAKQLLVPAVTDDERTMQILVVCTANVSRSPLAAALLNRAADVRELPMVATSAGTRQTGTTIDEAAHQAGAELGVHYPEHQPRVMTLGLLADDGRDLIVAMTREHVREIVLLDALTLARTFTLKELVRRADALGRLPAPYVTLDSWLAALNADRDQRELLGHDNSDDVADPFGRSATAHQTTAAELDDLTRRLAAHLEHIVAE